MKGEALIIKKRGEDGTKVVSLRIRQELLKQIDDISKKAGYSRNEVICIMLQHGVENVEIR